MTRLRGGAEMAGEHGLSVALLGAFEVTFDGRPVPLTTGRLRTVLAVLALSAGRPVTIPRLAEAVWDEKPPASPKGSIQTYIGRLRGVLGGRYIATSPAGFTLLVPPEAVDAVRFGRLLDEAAAANDPRAERDLLTEAIALWHGEPFEGVRSRFLELTEHPRLMERYLAAMERRIDLDVAAGEAGDLVVPLRDLTARFPLRESLWVRLLTVLRRAGRQAEALEGYETIRTRLAEDLGSEPGPGLRAVYAELLAGTPPARAGRPERAPAAPEPSSTPVVPRQLPAEITGFTGRAGALDRLDGLIGRRRPGGGAVIAAVTGTAGVGKTALAVYWGHRVSGRFPDGQLYVNLRGFGPGDRPVDPSDAVLGFLEALGVPKERIPEGLDQRIGLYRSLLAGRRVLVVLDNARDSTQVRPLLPGGAGCTAVVTSRDHLVGLVATEAATPIVLDLMTDREARDLLRSRLSPRRTETDAGAVDEIIESCARLPLALAIAGARAALRPDLPLRLLAGELRGSPGLDALDIGDDTASVRSVFSWSYRALGAPTARMFRLLGLHPTAEVPRAAAASTAGISMAEARAVLAELTRAQLLTEPSDGTYGRHDLLREYALELAERDETGAERRAALHRLLDHYLRSAYASMRRLQPQRAAIELTPARDGVTVTAPADRAGALAWFTTEHAALLAVVRLAEEHGFDAHVVQFAWSLRNYLDWQGHWSDLAAVLSSALRSARRTGDVPGQVTALRGVARAHAIRDDIATASRHLQEALRLATGHGDPLQLAHTHQSLSTLADRGSDHAGMLRHAEQALELFRVAGNDNGVAVAHNNIGYACAHLGDLHRAVEHCREALAVHTRLGSVYGQAGALDSLGYALHRLGEPAEAASAFRRSVELQRQAGDRHGTATVLRHLGESLAAAGEVGEAREAYKESVSILENLGHADAAMVRELLREL